MADDEPEKMTLSPMELEVFRAVALVVRYALPTLQVILLLLKLLAGWDASWWFVLLPAFLYLLVFRTGLGA